MFEKLWFQKGIFVESFSMLYFFFIFFFMFTFGNTVLLNSVLSHWYQVLSSFSLKFFLFQTLEPETEGGTPQSPSVTVIYLIR